MLSNNKLRKGLEIGVGMTAIALLFAGCGGSNNSSNPPAASFSGIVADGYLSGAKVCLDTNNNGVCDAGEPSGVTAANGAYTITGITPGQETKFPIVAEVPATSVDQDTGAPVGTAFTLTAPAGASFVSPLTTLVQDKIAAGASSASAVAAVGQTLGIAAASGVNVLDNYVALKATATNQSNGYFRAHEAAKTVAEVLKRGKSALGSATTPSTDSATQSTLLSQAEAVLQYQASSNVAAAGAVFTPVAVNANSIPGAGTLKSLIAANNAGAALAAATQAVTINFDVVKGATTIGTGGCSSTSLTLGSLNTPGKIKDLRFYVSSVALIDAAGKYTPVVMDVNANQDRNVALLDFEDGAGSCAGGTAATYTAITGKVAPGNYVGIALTVGVPGKLNHSDITAATTPTPLQNSAMNWSWQSGRKFTKIEFTPDVLVGGVASAVPAATTMVHLGATGCKANPASGEVINGCGSPNRMAMSFANFNAATQKIALDLNALWGGVDLTTKKTWMAGKTDCFTMMGGMQMCMGGSASYYFDKFQIDLNTGLPINDGAAQKLFVVR